jgi:hypothetical protein
MLDEYSRLERQVLAFLENDGAESHFNELALAAYRFQRRSNRPFANFCAAHPEPANWTEIPAVPQSVFKQFVLSVAAPESRVKTFHTSGTTGASFGRHAFVSLTLYEAAVRQGWQRLHLPKVSHFVFVPHPADAPHSSLSHMMGSLDALARETTWLIRPGGTLRPEFEQVIDRTIRAGEPVALLGTALSFLNVFERLGARSFPLPPGSFAMETGGYKGSGRDIAKDELYAMFGEFLGLAPGDVINEYGMTELSSQCYTRGLGGYHASPPWMRAVVFNPETGAEVAVGATGVLRLFDLANLGSVLAIETQDLAIRREHGFELLGRDPAAIPRGCSRLADEQLQQR